MLADTWRDANSNQTITPPEQQRQRFRAQLAQPPDAAAHYHPDRLVAYLGRPLQQSSMFSGVSHRVPLAST